ncbi:MAG: hypothetical protein WCK74_10315 [Gemmatimonadaceae bacterium]
MSIAGRFGAAGMATLSLPASAIANGALPFIACYVSTDQRTWISVAQIPVSASDTYCAITGVGTGAPMVTLVNAFSGDYYYIVAVW